MNEAIQGQGDEVSIVIYDAPLPPKYFRLTKRFIKTLFVVVPILLLLIFTGLFFWGMANRIKEAPKPELPSVMDESKNKIFNLQNEVAALTRSNNELVAKLSSAPATTTSDDPNLLLIKKPYGMQNLIAKKLVTLDQIQLVQEPTKTTLKFQIISSTPEQRVTGHVIVFMLSDAGILAYPEGSNTNLFQGIRFSSGEPFSVSRLRPTNADFSQKLTGKSAKFMIYIFNREGDLLLTQETDSFKVEAK